MYLLYNQQFILLLTGDLQDRLQKTAPLFEFMIPCNDVNLKVLDVKLLSSKTYQKVWSLADIDNYARNSHHLDHHIFSQGILTQIFVSHCDPGMGRWASRKSNGWRAPKWRALEKIYNSL